MHAKGKVIPTLPRTAAHAETEVAEMRVDPFQWRLPLEELEASSSSSRKNFLKSRRDALVKTLEFGRAMVEEMLEYLFHYLLSLKDLETDSNPKKRLQGRRDALVETLKFGQAMVEEMLKNEDASGMETLFDALGKLKGLQTLRSD